ncbi:hypothetical protein RFI_19746 [Reticulomyxa filosa]|uniref:Uncharacterized protein n=1 Tax=Reticulomyxa filosa TaxID=46433 RepID=X6MUA6_RETFI|nr:hypothetical protein RFI_19746 [Reticulomyxa filosa]|eukprot:ETO17573.1 hypothetical protein RFI_19746 [Reticulomyxa filosa]
MIRRLYLYILKLQVSTTLEKITSRFNEMQQQSEQKIDENGKEDKTKNYMQNFGLLKRRNKKTTNPEINRIFCSGMYQFENQIKKLKKLLEKWGLIERFKGLPMVKVTFTNTNGTKRAMQEKNIYIGFNMAECEYFDNFPSRPRSMIVQRKRNVSIVEGIIISRKYSIICTVIQTRQQIGIKLSASMTEMMTFFQQFASAF